MGSKLSEKSLENIALYYLQRFSSSVENLRQVLRRRVDKKLRASASPSTKPEQMEAWLSSIEVLLDRLQRSGLLDDARYAQSTAESLLRRGQSLKKVQLKLRSKGLNPDQIAEGLKVVRALNDGREPDGAAALAYARRRRIGPYRRAPADEAKRRKELAALARAGFSYGLARKVVEAESADSLEQDIESL
jgi:regulatory protein